MRDIQEFVCWQLADELKRQIIELTNSGPAASDYKFRDHIREASESATANMAEGFKYFQPAQFARFLQYAVGSLGETQNRLLDAFDRKFIDRKRYQTLRNLAGAAMRATESLMRSKLHEAERQRRMKASRAKPNRHRRPQLPEPE